MSELEGHELRVITSAELDEFVAAVFGSNRSEVDSQVFEAGMRARAIEGLVMLREDVDALTSAHYAPVPWAAIAAIVCESAPTREEFDASRARMVRGRLAVPDDE